ncbi:MAG: imidazole glycerol phosphate synthase subunit HisH [Lachnospiraceae bacterium]|nr:imidazole glycerol phosphate synthase subunit HisH [Lachnospiraceae bacterium]
MIAIIDYDAGNIRSVEKAVQSLGVECKLTRDREEILKAEKVILPGVGAFGDAMKKLEEYGLIDTIHKVVDNGTPFLGICLGLQVMFDESEESPGVKGLSLLPGKVVRFTGADGLKVPQIGWNSLEVIKRGRLLKDIYSGAFVYFVHSYYVKADNKEDVSATAQYGETADVAVEHNNIFGCQFHPEKSSSIGIKIINNFINI